MADEAKVLGDGSLIPEKPRKGDSRILADGVDELAEDQFRVC